MDEGIYCPSWREENFIKNNIVKKILFPQFSIWISSEKYSEYRNIWESYISMHEEYHKNWLKIKYIAYYEMCSSYEIVIYNQKQDRSISILYGEISWIYKWHLDKVINEIINSIKFHKNAILNENEKNYRLIQSYYNFISTKKYEEAYNLKLNPWYTIEKFKHIYSDVNNIDIEFPENYFFTKNNKYTFKAFLNLNNSNIEAYSVEMEIINWKLKTISSKKIN